MEKKSSNPLARFERPPVHYPMLIGAVIVGILLVVVVVIAARDQGLLLAGSAAAALALFVVLILIYIANNRRMAAVDDRKFIQWNAASPDIQRQNVNLEVRELARVLSVGDDQLADLLSAYIVAEDLALRQIQQEENLPLMRHVSIGKTPFDAVLADQDLLTCVEVAFLVVPDVRQEKIESMLRKITLARKNLAEQKSRLRLRLMVVLVTQLTNEEEELLRSLLVTRRFSETPVDVDIRLLDFETLQKVYVSE